MGTPRNPSTQRDHYALRAPRPARLESRPRRVPNGHNRQLGRLQPRRVGAQELVYSGAAGARLPAGDLQLLRRRHVQSGGQDGTILQGQGGDGVQLRQQRPGERPADKRQEHDALRAGRQHNRLVSPRRRALPFAQHLSRAVLDPGIGKAADGSYDWAVVIGGQPDVKWEDGCTTKESGVNNAGLWLFSRKPVASPEAIGKMHALLKAKASRDRACTRWSRRGAPTTAST